MTNRSRWIFLLAFGATPWLPGCGATQMYPGPARPAGETAVVQIESVEVFAVDNAPIGTSKKISLLAGEHEIRLSHGAGSFGEQIITYVFTAEGGRRYVLGADYNYGRHFSWTPWIKDVETGRIVGGRP